MALLMQLLMAMMGSVGLVAAAGGAPSDTSGGDEAAGSGGKGNNGQHNGQGNGNGQHNGHDDDVTEPEQPNETPTEPQQPDTQEPDQTPEEPAAQEPEQPTNQEPQTPPPAETPEDTQNQTPPPAETPEETPDQTPAPGGINSGGDGVETPVGEDPVDVVGGRVTTLAFDGISEGDTVRVLGGLEHGNVTVNPDNSFALVLTGESHTGPLSFQFEVTHADGSVTTHSTDLNVTAGPVEGGWGEGNFYMLETDESGNLELEWGENHRDVYVSGSDKALSLADIAARENLDVSKITGNWLVAHPQYGSSEGMALADDAGDALWRQLSVNSLKEPASNWLRLEAGYSYDLNPAVIGTRGESELHPTVVTSYGEGAKPILMNEFVTAAEGIQNMVFAHVELGEGTNINGGMNLLFDDITSKGDIMSVQRVDGFTVRNSEFYDIIYEKALTSPYWDGEANRLSGVYAAHDKGVLLENNLFDKIAWADGYDPGVNSSVDDPMPPTIYSHNVYIQSSNLDVTFRDNITMRAASFGLQLRPGGVIEDNVFLDNNAAFFVAGAPSNGEYLGNYSLVMGNVVTSGAGREYGGRTGQTTGGIGNYEPLSTFVDNIVAHLADPNNPDELASKTQTFAGLASNTTFYYNDTIVYNWAGAGKPENFQDANTGGLNQVTLDATTIQNFAAELLGKQDATIADLADYLRASAEGAFDGTPDSKLIIDFFQAGFGLTPEGRLEAETLRFVPSDLADGIRWDNRLNWSTQDLPGTLTHDSVDLAGNWVNYGGTTHIDNLDFGEGGKLSVTQGYLEIGKEVGVGDAGATLAIDRAGQVWTDGYGDEDKWTIDVEGGRFANTGIFKGQVDMTVGDNGQAILATGGASFDLSAGSTLNIVGDDAKVGFDGAGGMSLLRLDDDSTLQFTAKDGGIGAIEEFRSGKFGETPNVASGANLGGATLKLDLSDIGTGAGNHVLMSVNELIGNFGDLEILGLGTDRDAEVVVDYATDTVTLKLGAAGKGSGTTLLTSAHDELNGNDHADALWQALTADHGVLADDPILDDADDEHMADILAH